MYRQICFRISIFRNNKPFFHPFISTR